MNRHFLIYILALLIFFFGCDIQKTNNAKVRLGGWDYSWMRQVKKELQTGNTEFRQAFDKLLIDAEEVLKEGVYSVTFKNLAPPGGTIHDYMSMGPYWWPDPDKPDGLPYIRRDGVVNPERDKLDSQQLNKMINAVRLLSLAWFFTDNISYAEKAADLLRVWFLEPETMMNPHLNFAQAIPGITEGRFIGIIDGRSFAVLVDAIALLETSSILKKEEIREIREWFTKYLQWLTESEFGKEADNYINNHSVAYDVQTCGIAYFLGNEEYIKNKISELPKRRIDSMIEPDGGQPYELARTLSFGYSVGNLQNFFDAGKIGLLAGVNIFDYVSPNGASVKKALDFLNSYIGREKDWPYRQIHGWERTENSLGLLIREAAVIYKSEFYRNIWEETFYERVKRHYSLLVVRGE